MKTEYYLHCLLLVQKNKTKQWNLNSTEGRAWKYFLQNGMKSKSTNPADKMALFIDALLSFLRGCGLLHPLYTGGATWAASSVSSSFSPPSVSTQDEFRRSTECRSPVFRAQRMMVVRVAWKIIGFRFQTQLHLSKQYKICSLAAW